MNSTSTKPPRKNRAIWVVVWTIVGVVLGSVAGFLAHGDGPKAPPGGFFNHPLDQLAAWEHFIARLVSSLCGALIGGLIGGLGSHTSLYPLEIRSTPPRERMPAQRPVSDAEAELAKLRDRVAEVEREIQGDS